MNVFIEDGRTEDPDQAVGLGSTRPPAAEIKTPETPGAGKVLLGLGLGCLVLCTAVGLLAAVGAFIVASVVKNSLVVDGEAEAPLPPDFKLIPGENGELPESPLRIPKPADPSLQMGQADLMTVDTRALPGWAMNLYEKGLYKAAVQCQFAAVMKTNTGRYNLACYYARAGNIQAALYWLQVAVREEESNAEWASQDADLEQVRKDRRWPTVLAYMKAGQRYWEASGVSETSLVLPQGATSDKALPLFIGLHGLGHNAREFVGPAMYQVLADEMGVAFLGVSGTIPRGKKTFVWSEDPGKDLDRIDAALKELAGKVTPAAGQTVLFGFSQGAIVAADLAARHPDRFAGAIVISPGNAVDIETTVPEARPEHRRQGIVVACGALEHTATVAKTKHFAMMFQTLGARVFLKLYPDVHAHGLPPDYTQRLPDWGKFILNPDAPLPPP